MSDAELSDSRSGGSTTGTGEEAYHLVAAVETVLLLDATITSVSHDLVDKVFDAYRKRARPFEEGGIGRGISRATQDQDAFSRFVCFYPSELALLLQV